MCFFSSLYPSSDTRFDWVVCSTLSLDRVSPLRRDTFPRTLPTKDHSLRTTSHERAPGTSPLADHSRANSRRLQLPVPPHYDDRPGPSNWLPISLPIPTCLVRSRSLHHLPTRSYRRPKWTITRRCCSSRRLNLSPSPDPVRPRRRTQRLRTSRICFLQSLASLPMLQPPPPPLLLPRQRHTHLSQGQLLRIHKDILSARCQESCWMDRALLALRALIGHNAIWARHLPPCYFAFSSHADF